MKNNDLTEKIKRIQAKDVRYSTDAYHFINAAVRKVSSAEGEDRKHITALELLTGIRQFAAECFGPFAAQVLREWNLERGIDVGNIVFNLIEEQVLYASENDSPEDFAVSFDLFEGLPQIESADEASANIEVPIIV